MNQVFICQKDVLSKILTKMGLALSKWQSQKGDERHHFLEALFGKLLDIIASSEGMISYLNSKLEKSDKSYAKDVRVAAASDVLSFLTDMSTISIELADLKKSKKAEEKKIRQAVVNDYDQLVRELVNELNVMCDRFNEYRVTTVQEVMNIMSEAKREEMGVIVDTMDVNKYIKQQASNAIAQEEALQHFRTENYELKATLMKMRSMYNLKETALRASFDKKLKKLSDENKKAEEKLWDSYRESDAREGILKKQLSQMQKSRIIFELAQEQKREEVRRSALLIGDSDAWQVF